MSRSSSIRRSSSAPGAAEKQLARLQARRPRRARAARVGGPDCFLTPCLACTGRICGRHRPGERQRVRHGPRRRPEPRAEVAEQRAVRAGAPDVGSFQRARWGTWPSLAGAPPASAAGTSARSRRTGHTRLWLGPHPGVAGRPERDAHFCALALPAWPWTTSSRCWPSCAQQAGTAAPARCEPDRATRGGASPRLTRPLCPRRQCWAASTAPGVTWSPPSGWRAPASDASRRVPTRVAGLGEWRRKAHSLLRPVPAGAAA